MHFLGVGIALASQDMGQLAASTKRAGSPFAKLWTLVDVTQGALGCAEITPAKDGKVSADSSIRSSVDMRVHARAAKFAVGKVDAVRHAVLIGTVGQSAGGFGVVASIAQESRTDGDLG